MNTKDNDKESKKPANQTPKQGEGKQVIELRKNLDKMFGPKKGDGSNRT